MMELKTRHLLPVVWAIATLIILGIRFVFNTGWISAFFWGTIGTVVLLVAAAILLIVAFSRGWFPAEAYGKRPKRRQ